MSWPPRCDVDGCDGETVHNGAVTIEVGHRRVSYVHLCAYHVRWLEQAVAR